MITKLDYVAIPSQDAERLRTFYVDTLGLRPDEQTATEFWVADTCCSIWEPAKFGMDFAPQKNAHLALHVDDVEAARAELEGKGIEFVGEHGLLGHQVLHARAEDRSGRRCVAERAEGRLAKRPLPDERLVAHAP